MPLVIKNDTKCKCVPVITIDYKCVPVCSGDSTNPNWGGLGSSMKAL